MRQVGGKHGQVEEVEDDSLPSQHLTCPRSLLGMHAYPLAKKDSSTEAYGKVDNIPYGVAPLPFDP